MILFENKEQYKDFVNLSIGRVYFRPITNGMLNSIRSYSTIAGTVINNNLFFQLFEYKIVCLSKRQINKLSVKDGDKLREKLKEILTSYGIIEEVKEEVKESEADLFKETDKQWFNKSANDLVGRHITEVRKIGSNSQS